MVQDTSLYSMLTWESPENLTGFKTYAVKNTISKITVQTQKLKQDYIDVDMNYACSSLTKSSTMYTL